MPAATTTPQRPCPPPQYIDNAFNALAAFQADHPANSGFGQLIASSPFGSAGTTDATRNLLLNVVDNIPVWCLTPQQMAAYKSTRKTDTAQSTQELNAFQGGILGFLSRLTSATTYIRAAELIVGVILVIVGIKQLAALYGVSVPKIPGVPFG